MGLFGEGSLELRMWREGVDESQRRSWEAVYRGDSPRGESWPVHLLANSLGTLTEIKLAALPSDRGPGQAVPFDGLHPLIVEKCATFYALGEYDSAVFHAFRVVEEQLRKKLGAAATDFGLLLVSAAFGQKDPKLWVSDVSAEQEAIHALFRGAIGAFKNPLSHRSVGYSDSQRVLELLAFASLLLRIIDEAKVKDTGFDG